METVLLSILQLLQVKIVKRGWGRHSWYGVLGDCGFQLPVLMLLPRTTNYWQLALNERLNKS